MSFLILLLLAHEASSQIEGGQLKPVFTFVSTDIEGLTSDSGRGEWTSDGDLETVTYVASPLEGKQWISYILPAPSSVTSVMVYIPHRSIISSEYHFINEEEQKEANKDIQVTIRTLIPTTEVEEYVVKTEVLTQYPQPPSFETGTVTNPLRNLGPEFDLQGTLKIMELSEDSYNRETRYNVTWEALETSCELVRSQEYTIDGEVFSDQTEVGDTDHTASEGTILEFDCGSVEGGSVFIKTDQNVLEVAETKMFGVSGRISPLVDPLDFPGLEASHIYHVTLQNGIDKNILILRENGEYIGEEQPSYIFKLNTDKGRTSEFELRRDSGLRMKDCLNAEVSDGWWPFSGAEGVCDGTKSEDKFNTWTLHFSLDHFLVYCDGVQFISLHVIYYCTVFTPDMTLTEEGLFAVLDYTKSVDVLLMPGLLGLDVYHLGEYGVTKMEADHQFQRSCKNIERDIMELCTEEYDMFGADGVVSPEFQFLYDHIMDEFKTSIAYTALLSQIERDERIKREEQWMKDSYPEYLESMFKKTRGDKENLEYLKNRKEEILSSLRRDSRLMQHDTISELFKKASIFYTSMSSLFEDRLNPLVDEFDLFARGDGVRPVLFKEIEGLITSLQDRVKATPSSIGRPQEMTTGVWQTVVPEAWETQSLLVKFKNVNNGKTDWRWNPIAPPSPMPTLPLIKPIQDYDAVLHFINFYENKDKDQHVYDFGIEVIGPDQHGYDFGIEIIGPAPEQPF